MSESVTWISLTAEDLKDCDLFSACQEFIENPEQLKDTALCTGTCKTGTCMLS